MAQLTLNKLVEETITRVYVETGNECDALDAGYDQACKLGTARQAMLAIWIASVALEFDS